jgi:uncharacterized membrane protein (TIGR02234 family)
MTPQRLRLISMAAIVLEAGFVALSWSQTWYTVTVTDSDTRGTYTVGGDVAGGALLPLALASLTLVLALALAGPVFRVILGVLDALLGVCVVVVAAWSLSDPVRASLPALAAATGISSTPDGATATAAPWPIVGLGAGVLMIVTGIAVAITSRAWPASGSRYTRSRLETPDGDAVRDWDALSEGDDPTAAPR